MQSAWKIAAVSEHYTEEEAEYFLRRARVERAMERDADVGGARLAHRQMAECYEAKAQRARENSCPSAPLCLEA